MASGAWPFLVRGMSCLVNSDNERDSNLLNSTVATLCGLARSGLGLCVEPCKQVKLLRETGVL